MKKTGFVCLCIAAMLLSGCATVKPWQREYLADPVMLLDDDLAGSFYREITSLREAAEGGTSSGSGGGCGCN